MNQNKIHRLDEQTINRIAAGEIIQRSSGVVKELIENSIDAGATTIIVTSKNGGIDSLLIQDNGCGIHRSDMDIVCERFTTSKISKFEDLENVSTFGFRGEALASISHVSHLTITSRTRDDACAYKAKYQDGSLVGAKGETLSTSTSSSLIKPCAANIGTSIHVEDLFFNMQHRRKALSNFNEEYQRIQDVITKYAIHYGDKRIAFTCKKSNTSSPDFHCTNSSSTLLNIQIIHGASVCKELILFTNMIAPPSLSFNSLTPIKTIQELRYEQNIYTTIFPETNSISNTTTTTNSSLGNNINDFHLDTPLCVPFVSSSTNPTLSSPPSPKFQYYGYISNANYSRKKSVFILFINNRLVESVAIKKSIELIYSDILPKHTFPFIYLSLSLPPENVDVNVHPTKKEVHFLYEEQIINILHQKLYQLLIGANNSRVFTCQTTTLFNNTQFSTIRNMNSNSSSKSVPAVSSTSASISSFETKLEKYTTSQRSRESNSIQDETNNDLNDWNNTVDKISHKKSDVTSADVMYEKDLNEMQDIKIFSMEKCDDRLEQNDVKKLHVHAIGINEENGREGGGENNSKDNKKRYSHHSDDSGDGRKVSAVSKSFSLSRSTSNIAPYTIFDDIKPVSDHYDNDMRNEISSKGITSSASASSTALSAPTKVIASEKSGTSQKHLIRTDPKMSRIDNYFRTVTSSTQSKSDKSSSLDRSSYANVHESSNTSMSVDLLHEKPLMEKQKDDRSDKSGDSEEDGITIHHPPIPTCLNCNMDWKFVQSSIPKISSFADYNKKYGMKNALGNNSITSPSSISVLSPNIAKHSNVTNAINASDLSTAVATEISPSGSFSSPSSYQKRKSGTYIPSCSCCVYEAKNTLFESSPKGLDDENSNYDKIKKRILPSDEASTAQIGNISHAAKKLAKFTPILQYTKNKSNSVQHMIKCIQQNKNEGIFLMLKNYILVGIVSLSHLLIQYETQLILLNYNNLLYHLFYQLVIMRLETMSIISLESPVNIEDFIFTALNCSSNENQSQSQSQLSSMKDKSGEESMLTSNRNHAKILCSTLISHRQFLYEKFRISISSNGYLEGLPEILVNYFPVPEMLPLFLLGISTSVPWKQCKNSTDESDLNVAEKDYEDCYAYIANELSLFYMQFLTPVEKLHLSKSYAGEVGTALGSDKAVADNPLRYNLTLIENKMKEIVADMLLPAIRFYLIPSCELYDDSSIAIVASLENLYKVFERC